MAEMRIHYPVVRQVMEELYAAEDSLHGQLLETVQTTVAILETLLDDPQFEKLSCFFK